ncbi:DUF6516 family protein [Methylomarinum sp. Ch1-1]|uniref:DUF6516 family protein n=1 Tax=Methylomarinum roseum TaxID=3067653 RepID=A0AAU7NS71_9GAMM|nr:DUF6516 family protein [Methylomarinum sp. Ch1-1]MDP4520161.1 DUF6516 family protein [Methylomarinum sp. Ch1-1]
MKDRLILANNSFAEMVVWRVPSPLAGSAHDVKYRLAFIVDGACVLRYDNEAGKGDHKHINDQEVPYTFTTPRQLLADFWRDVDLWRQSHE